MSSDYEGLPQTIQEAMAAGLPIVTTNAGGVVDVVEEKGNAIVVPCGDLDGLVAAMCELTASKTLREQFSKRSLELSKQYSIENCAEQYRQLYLR